MEELDLVIDKNSKRYYKKGTTILHRLDGPAIEFNWGNKEWWVNGQLHRDDGPAIEHPSSGAKYWYLNGKRHRIGGPACEYSSGHMIWHINGIRLSPEKEAIMNAWYENGKS